MRILIIYFLFFFLNACKGQTSSKKGTEANKIVEAKTSDTTYEKYKIFFPDTSKVFTSSISLFNYLRPLSNNFLETKNLSGLPLYSDFSDDAIALKKVYTDVEDILVSKHLNIFFGKEDCLNILAAKASINTQKKIEFFNKLPSSLKESVAGKNTYKNLLRFVLPGNYGINFSKQFTANLITVDNNIQAFDKIIQKQKTLIVLGASWCTPCVVQERKLKKNGSQLYQSGVSIIGIYFERNNQAFLNYTSKEKFSWPCYLLKEGFDNISIKKLGYHGIPLYIFLDETGIIQKETADINEMIGYIEKK